MVLSDYESDHETLLQKANMSTLQIGKIKTLAAESFKTFHSLNLINMDEIFQINPPITHTLRSKKECSYSQIQFCNIRQKQSRNTWTHNTESSTQ